MAPKASSSSSKKKSSSSSSDEIKTPKFKLPTTFITRPSNKNDDRSICNVYLSKKVMKALEIDAASMCVVGKLSESGVVAIAHPGDDSMPDNVVQISDSLRAVGNIILGDRLELKKVTLQPEYATSVTLGSRQGVEIPAAATKMVEKLLDECGLVMPGMVFPCRRISDDLELDLVVIDINDMTAEDLPSISKLSLDSAESQVFYLSPPGIFRKGSTSVTLSLEASPPIKYGLPQPISYNSVGGLRKEIDVLKRTIELPLHQPTLFAEFGVTPPRGILLHGPPGTGKTMLLRCVASEANAHILTINGPSIVSKYLGETEAALRDMFNEARLYQPSIIFIDEIDSLAPSRSSDDSGEVESRVVATLLTLMDGMGSSGRVVVVAATNRPNAVDLALRRPGRLDQEVEIGIPDVDARHDILIKQFGKVSEKRHELTAADIQLIASRTHGYVGADLVALCREAVMKTLQRGVIQNLSKDVLKITLRDVEDAMTEIRPSAMREIFLEMPKVYWSDIGGQNELKLKMKEMIQLPLEQSESFLRLGVSAPKGVLLYGPPGCSKTLTAKALATESGINFLAVKGPEIFNKYVGESERAIREIFRKARAAAPSIIFFDEIDALSPDRDSGGSTSAASHVLTSLLNEIDGVEELNGVIIVAATNRPDEIDSALLRPGRLDRHIYVGPPDFEGRLQILQQKTKSFKIEDSEVTLQDLAHRTEGCSGAEVVLLCQEAGLAAIMEDPETDRVQQNHFEKALNGISRGINQEMLDYYFEFQSRSGISR
ncbi:LANO_0G12112g1_1 [Lachancea nothofagi CBS 11611]|uniref:LANO_0G12112g1_1 n=1 Tax=Lachancea nothofagi CBS 11611 TaxID=1266666 RepID=A0A1G4KJN8_9SACH|nr:LANO_0G12112g1_1 [Lachancea nothofagi CBS 11611]